VITDDQFSLAWDARRAQESLQHFALAHCLAMSWRALYWDDDEIGKTVAELRDTTHRSCELAEQLREQLDRRAEEVGRGNLEDAAGPAAAGA